MRSEINIIHVCCLLNYHHFGFTTGHLRQFVIGDPFLHQTSTDTQFLNASSVYSADWIKGTSFAATQEFRCPYFKAGVVNMRVIVFHAVGDIRLENVANPVIQETTNAIVRLTASANCGSTSSSK